MNCSGKVLRGKDGGERERRCLFWCYICNLLECTHAAFPSSVWDGSYKNREDGGEKHAENKPVTQAANRQNILHQTYCRYLWCSASRIELLILKKKNALPHSLTHPKIISIYLQDALDLCICQFAIRSPKMGVVNMLSNFIAIVVLQKVICKHLDMKLECGIWE